MVEQAKAQHDEALAQYTSSVVSALRDANVALSRCAELSEQRYLGGTRSALDWLDAESTRNDAEQQRISGEAQLLASYVTLQKSLGLGWQSE